MINLTLLPIEKIAVKSDKEIHDLPEPQKQQFLRFLEIIDIEQERGLEPDEMYFGEIAKIISGLRTKAREKIFEAKIEEAEARGHYNGIRKCYEFSLQTIENQFLKQYLHAE
ncbi:MAG: hypothetical protein LBF71_02035 [Campylobacteraceae bacterium]|jgi:hypothetical protein|nr:hypothetical protein [Campylobacteraceae bacterium]